MARALKDIKGGLGGGVDWGVVWIFPYKHLLCIHSAATSEIRDGFGGYEKHRHCVFAIICNFAYGVVLVRFLWFGMKSG